MTSTTFFARQAQGLSFCFVLHREALIPRIKRAFWDRPTFECSFGFQPEVIVQMRIMMFLDNKTQLWGTSIVCRRPLRHRIESPLSIFSFK